MGENQDLVRGELARAQQVKGDLYTFLQVLTAVVIPLVLLCVFVGRVVVVDGVSMLPTLRHGDVLLLRSVGYTPKQGDVVVLTKDFSYHVGDSIIKRVIAVGGQRVRIDYDENKVYVDGVALDEPYLNEPMVSPSGASIQELTVPEGSVFVMGDNRNHSGDSRLSALGTIDERYIIGQAVLTLLPLGDLGPIH
jgi:signal peptidase I